MWGDLKEIAKGTKLVSKGEYCGTTKSQQFDSNLHQFVEIDDQGRSGVRVPLGGGSLDWRADQGDLKIGEVYDVIWEGKEKLTRGKYAGKETNTYKILRYEEDELPRKFVEKRTAARLQTSPTVAGAEAHLATVSPAQTEALDDLS
jgi:hypothetical protein